MAMLMNLRTTLLSVCRSAWLHELARCPCRFSMVAHDEVRPCRVRFEVVNHDNVIVMHFHDLAASDTHGDAVLIGQDFSPAVAGGSGISAHHWIG